MQSPPSPAQKRQQDNGWSRVVSALSAVLNSDQKARLEEEASWMGVGAPDSILSRLMGRDPLLALNALLDANPALDVATASEYDLAVAALRIFAGD